MAELPPASQEIEHVNRRLVALVATSVVVFGVLLCFVAHSVLGIRVGTLSHASQVSAPARPDPVVSEIRMQLYDHKPGAGQVLQAQQRERLRHYGWVDQSHGIVRIPIEVAMDLESEEVH